MHRRLFLAAGGVLGLSGLARSSLAAGTQTVALLWISSPASERHITALREGLKTHGHAEPGNLHIERAFMVDTYEALDAAARDVARRGADVVVTLGSTAAMAMKKATDSMPVVMIIGADPVKQGYAASFSKPGGNMTGVCLISTETGGKRLELLQRVAPKAKRVALLYNESSAIEARYVGVVAEMGRAIGLQIVPAAVRVASDIDRAIPAAVAAGAEGFTVAASTMLVAHAARVVAAIAKARLPAVYPNDDYVQVGGILSYGPNLLEAFRITAGYVARVLKGAKTADMPIDQYSKQEIVANPRAARRMGIEMPHSILGLADRVVEG